MGFEPISDALRGHCFTIKPTKYGGPDATRTRYLLLARQVLSQLSYWPKLMLINLSFVSILPKFMCDREELNLLSIFGDPYRT